MNDQARPRKLPVPRRWTSRVRSAAVQAISLAQFALGSARGAATERCKTPARDKAEADRLRQEIALLREEIRIKDARMERIAQAPARGRAAPGCLIDAAVLCMTRRS